jgi:hypothetical protein
MFDKEINKMFDKETNKMFDKEINTYKIPGMSVCLSVCLSVTLQIQENCAVVFIGFLKVKNYGYWSQNVFFVLFSVFFYCFHSISFK